MTEISGRGDENLRQKTEAYFCRVVAVSSECASIVLRSCVELLPEAETTASLASRCIEALSLIGDGDGVEGCLDGVKTFRPEDILLILESLNLQLTDNHDLLYEIIDLYIKANGRKVTEDQKARMCNYIDCSILSHKLLMHAVRNPRLPLRFVVQAMFMGQLNTRRSIFSLADNPVTSAHKNPQTDDPITLGAILQRDAALRQVDKLKQAMTATNTRIQTLEKELDGMRKLLCEMVNDGSSSIRGSGRSASFRFSSEGRKIERGQMGSVSALNVRSGTNNILAEGSSSSKESSEGSWASDKNLGRRIIYRLKNAFGLKSLVTKKKREDEGSVKLERNREICEEAVGGIESFVVMKKDQASHRRSRSQS